MKYKTRVPVCGAIMLNDTWEKVGRVCHRNLAQNGNILTRILIAFSAFLSKVGSRLPDGASRKARSTSKSPEPVVLHERWVIYHLY